MSTTEKSRISIRKTIITILGVVFSVLGLMYAFRNVKIDDLLESAGRVQFLPLLGSVFVYWAGLVVVRVFLIKYLLASAGTLRFSRMYRCVCIGFLANNILPFRIGDVARSAAISKASNIKFSTVFGSMALERMLDFFMVALVAFAAIQLGPVPENIQIAAILSASILGAAFLIFMFVVRRNHEEIEDHPNRIKLLIWNLWVRFSHGFSAFKSVKGIVYVFAMAVGIWVLCLISVALKLAAFDLPWDLATSLILLSAIGLSVAIPSAPGYVGVYHAAVTLVLVNLGIDEPVAAAFGLFSWAVDILSGNLLGAVSMVMEGMSLSDLRKSPTQ